MQQKMSGKTMKNTFLIYFKAVVDELMDYVKAFSRGVKC